MISTKALPALEIEYGALRSEVLRSDKPPICLFYFRESPDYANMPVELWQIYQDESEHSAKLANLKEQIRARFGQDTKNYAAEVDETGLTVSKDWAMMVADDIIEKLRQEWGKPSETPPDWKELEQERQEAFRESRTEHFSGRADAIADMVHFCLDDHSTPQIRLMQGESGSGKSGLMCKVMDAIQDKCLLLPFCCGLSPRSSLAENMLRYFISLICQELKLEDDSDALTKFQDLKDRFTELLFAASKKMRVVAVVDALDQFVANDESRHLLWISGRLPDNFRLLCSIIDGSETEAVKRLGGEVRPVPPISEEDKARIIRGIAERHHKQLNNAVVESILQKKTLDGKQAAQNPLYLSLIVQNLAMLDRYELEAVQQGIADGLSHSESLSKFMCRRIDEIPGEPEGAYLAILNRLEKLIGNDFVCSVCGMIAVSRSGLRESDIEGAFKELGMNFNSADFSWLRQMLRGHISQGDMQQWDFSHQSLRRAIRENWQEELKRLNDGIVGYFRRIIAEDGFTAREIMHHLCVANKPDWAAEVMATCSEVHEPLLAQGLADVYTEHETGSEFLLAVPVNTDNVDEKDRWFIMEIIRGCLSLLPENTRPFRVELMLSSLDMLEGQEDIMTQRVISAGENTVADLYAEMGESEKAGTYYQKFLQSQKIIFEQTNTLEALRNLSVAYERMGKHLMTLGRIDDAGIYVQKTVDLLEALHEQSATLELLRSLAVAYDRMGQHLSALGRIDEAWEYFQKSLDISTSLYEQNCGAETLRDIMVAWNRTADFLMMLGRLNEAGDYYAKALKSAEILYEQERTGVTLRNLAYSWGKVGNFCMARNLWEPAELYYSNTLRAYRLLYEQSYTSAASRDMTLALDKLGDILFVTGRIKESGDCYFESLCLSETLYTQDNNAATLLDFSVSCDKMGDVITALGATEKAEEYYRKALDAVETLHKQIGTTTTLRSLSVSLSKMGNHKMAMGCMDEAGVYYDKAHKALEQIYEQTGMMSALRDLSVSWNKMGNHLIALGRAQEAIIFYQKALDARERIYEQGGMEAALKDVIFTLDKIGDCEHAMKLHDKAHAHRLKALELFEQYVKHDPSQQKFDSYFRNKAMRSETEK